MPELMGYYAKRAEDLSLLHIMKGNMSKLMCIFNKLTKRRIFCLTNVNSSDIIIKLSTRQRDSSLKIEQQRNVLSKDSENSFEFLN